MAFLGGLALTALGSGALTIKHFFVDLPEAEAQALAEREAKHAAFEKRIVEIETSDMSPNEKIEAYEALLNELTSGEEVEFPALVTRVQGNLGSLRRTLENREAVVAAVGSMTRAQQELEGQMELTAEEREAKERLRKLIARKKELNELVPDLVEVILGDLPDDLDWSTTHEGFVLDRLHQATVAQVNSNTSGDEPEARGHLETGLDAALGVAVDRRIASAQAVKQTEELGRAKELLAQAQGGVEDWKTKYGELKDLSEQQKQSLLAEYLRENGVFSLVLSENAASTVEGHMAGRCTAGEGPNGVGCNNLGDFDDDYRLAIRQEDTRAALFVAVEIEGARRYDRKRTIHVPIVDTASQAFDVLRNIVREFWPAKANMWKGVGRYRKWMGEAELADPREFQKKLEALRALQQNHLQDSLQDKEDESAGGDDSGEQVPSDDSDNSGNPQDPSDDDQAPSDTDDSVDSPDPSDDDQTPKRKRKPRRVS